eukprot:1160081-Pelagomonas_calceolata.AAC.2
MGGTIHRSDTEPPCINSLTLTPKDPKTLLSTSMAHKGSLNDHKITSRTQAEVVVPHRLNSALIYLRHVEPINHVFLR